MDECHPYFVIMSQSDGTFDQKDVDHSDLFFHGPVILPYILNEPPHDKINKMTCAPSEDSDQPGHPHSLLSESLLTKRCAPFEDSDQPWHPPSLISLHCALIRSLRAQCFFMWTAKTLISLSAQVILLVLSSGGSSII